MKPSTLPASHYAADWDKDKLNSVDEVNAWGREYALHPQEDLLLRLCRSFHPYLMKYLGTICRGHVPTIGETRVSPDSKEFLQLFLGKDQAPNKPNFRKVAKSLHLAFKGMETEEIYDVLMELLVSIIRRYDPSYKQKIADVVGIINKKLFQRKRFHVSDVNRHLDFDCGRHLRLWSVCRNGTTRRAASQTSRNRPNRKEIRMNPNPTPIAKPLPLYITLRRRRKELRLLQSQVAESIGVSPQCVTLWESGRRRMELSKLPRLAQILKLDGKQLCVQGLREFHPSIYATLFETGTVAQTNGMAESENCMMTIREGE
jgi:DNA-binding XRE family transcriptional regulator